MYAEIQLKHYYVSRIEMKYNLESESVDTNNVQFSHDIAYRDDNNVEVILNCKISDEAGSNLELTLNGFFEIAVGDGKEKDSEDIKALCERNTLSILFPYLRSSISDISIKANISPIILPTINILALIDSQKKEKQTNSKIENT